MPEAVTDGPLARFARALDAPDDLPPGLVARPGADLARRFAVYRNNMTLGLVEALRAGFPVTARLVGEAFFRAMAREYVASEKPASPVLFEYGCSFPRFVAGFGPAAGVPYLADVAALEVARTQALHAADAPCLLPSAIARALAGSTPETWLATRVTAHPAARVVASPYPVAGIWSAHQDTASTVGFPGPWTGEAALVTRPAGAAQVRALTPAAGAFATALLSGSAIGEAGGIALAIDDGFDLGGTLVALAQAGALTGMEG